MEKTKRTQNFLSGPGGTGKCHVVHLIQRDMSLFFKHTVKPDDDPPIVLIAVSTGPAAFQISGSTIQNYLGEEKADAIKIRAHDAVNN